MNHVKNFVDQLSIADMVTELREQLAEQSSELEAERNRRWQGNKESSEELRKAAKAERELRQQLAERDAEIAELREQEVLLRRCLHVAHNHAIQCSLMVPSNSMTHLAMALCHMKEALAATEPKP